MWINLSKRTKAPPTPYSGGETAGQQKEGKNSQNSRSQQKPQSPNQYDSIRVLQNKLKVYGMNLDEAVKKHIEWRAKFRLAIVKKEQMDAATISKDNCCEVGKWLHGEGKSRWAGKPEFQRALDRHKAFHAEAGKVAQLINAQKYTEADAAIGNGTAFENVSKEVSTALILLKKAAGI